MVVVVAAVGVVSVVYVVGVAVVAVVAVVIVVVFERPWTCQQIPPLGLQSMCAWILQPLTPLLIPRI